MRSEGEPGPRDLPGSKAIKQWFGRVALGLALTWVASSAAAETPPNILVIMTDDQGHDTVTSQFMPNTKAMIGDQGITATNFMMSTALCCPSRASFLTGQYAHHHGVYTNRDPLAGSTVVNSLHEHGYFTGLAGKYLNSWPGTPRSEFDFWAAWINGYRNPTLNLQGTKRVVEGYATYLLRDQALAFLDQVPQDKPFFLLFSPHAPHGPATPAPGDENLYANLAPWRPESFNPPQQPDKPEWLASLPLLTGKKINQTLDPLRLNQLRCLHSVDLSVRDVLNKLAAEGKLDHTLVIFYSDNGIFWGEHRLLHKDRVYEEASHGPFLLRYPPLVSGPRVEDNVIGVIDLAPTICEIAGIPGPSGTDGHSLVPLLRGSQDWRPNILLEGWPASAKPNSEDAGEEEADSAVASHPPATQPPARSGDYRALRTKEFVYVETTGDKAELYDLAKDPLETRNLISDPNFAGVLGQLRRDLHQTTN